MKQKFGVGFGSLTDLPGCAQVVVSHGVYIPKQHRCNGRGTASNLERLGVARDAGYDYMLCTVRQDNPAQIAVLRKNGWRWLSAFISSASGMVIELWGKQLTEKDNGY